MGTPDIDGQAEARPRFDVRGTLGSGGVGVVYRAFDLARNTEVALKTLRRGGALDLFRFKREFRALADITHPNLATLYELHTAGDDWFFTMELVEGDSFIQYVRPHAPVQRDAAVDVTRTVPSGPPAESKDGTAHRLLRERIADAVVDEARLDAAFYQLVDGVHALHLAGKLHRDLKPSNVLVDRGGRVVLLDFGLISDLTPTEQTQDSLAGTPAYMSPEQASDGPLSEAADWYSVGVMLYEALTGRRPFEGSARDVIAAKQVDAPPPVRRFAPQAPAHLDRLCAALLDRDPAVRPDAGSIFAALGRAPSAATLQIASTTAPFVGRRTELEGLRDAFAACCEGRGVAVFVRGSSGMGKSALLRRFLDSFASDEALVLEGRCYEREAVPYKALDTVVDALTSHLMRLDEGAQRAVLPGDIYALARLFPVLRRVPAIASAAPLLSALDPLEVRRRAFVALRTLLESLSLVRPVVIAIDDLQWGDADSAAFLADLIHRPPAGPMLTVACHRAEDEAGNAVLALIKRGRGSSAPAGNVREISVDALPEVDALALLAEVGGERDDPNHRALVRDCGGSPFFLTELARARGTGSGITHLDDILQRHVEQLPPDARTLLQLCAVAARPLATDLALRAASLQREGAAVATLRTERLVRIRRLRDSQQIEPYHDRIREAVVRSLDADVRRALHRSLAEVFEGDGARDHEALVGHWLEAGEYARAGTHAALAAAAAEEALAFDQAARLYALAVEHGNPEPPQRRAMLTRRAHMLVNGGKVDEAADAFAAVAAEATGDEALELRRLSVEQRLRSGQYEPAMDEMRELLDAVGYRLPTSRTGALLSLLGQTAILSLRGEHQRKRPGPAAPALNRRIQVLHSLATGMAFVNPVVGRVLQSRLMRDALSSTDPRHLGIALSMSFGYLGSAGLSTLPRVLNLYDRGCALAQQLEDPLLQGWFDGGRGFAMFLYGRWREAVEWMRRGADTIHEVSTTHRWQLDVMDIFVPAALWYSGETAEMVRIVPGSLRNAHERGDRLAERGLRSWRSNATWLVLGRPEEAKAHVDATVPPRAPGEAFQLKHYYELLARSQIELYCGDGAAAHRRIHGVWKELQKSLILHVQSVRIEGWYLRGRADLALAASESGAARDDLHHDVERAAKRIAREATPWGTPLAAALRAGVAQQRGDLDQARASLSSAIEGFAAADMALYASVSRRRLGALIGGDQGAALVDAADRDMTGQAVVDPVAMAAMLLPGWDGAGRRELR